MQQQHSQKVLSILQQQALSASATEIVGSPCRYPPSNAAFPAIRNPQIVGSTFLEPQQYLTAIPVQPVIAPFPVAPVLSPLPVRLLTPQTDYDATSGVINPSILMNQQDILSSPVVMTPNQTQLQEQLQRKHDELQKLIMQQQDELRIVSEQLLLARYTLLQPMMTMNYNSQPTEATAVGTSNGPRNYNFNNNNTVQPQFNQYGFAMNSAEIRQQQDQQLMMEQQQNLNEQMQHHNQNHQNQNQHQVNNIHAQQPLHNQQHNNFSNIVQQQQQHQQDQQLFSSRNIPDLEQFAQEELYAFLNLSPIQNMNGSTQVDSNSDKRTETETVCQNSCVDNAISTQTPQTAPRNTVEFATTPINSNQLTPIPSAANNASDDSLLSYMQMTTASSQALNFPLSICDNDTETESEANKLMQSQKQNEPINQSASATLQQETQQRQSYFSTDTFSQDDASQSGNSQLATSTSILDITAPNLVRTFDNIQNGSKQFRGTSSSKTDPILAGCSDIAAKNLKVTGEDGT